MDITFIALGSIGDILPYATLAKALQDAGYRPTFVTTQDYQSLLNRMGLPGRFVPGDAQATIAKAGANMRLLMLGFAELSRALPEALDPSAPSLKDSKAVINQLPIGLFGFDLAERLAIPHIRVAVIPLISTADFPMMGWPTAPSILPGYNKLGYRVYERLTWLAMRQTINRWRTHYLGLASISASDYLRRLNRQPLLQGYSSQVVPRPDDWPQNVHLVGYWSPRDDSWRPPQTLSHFLQSGPAPIFIGFGSMPVEDPQAIMNMILEATSAGSVRTVVHSGWAGLTATDLPQQVHLLDYAPYNWLFPRMAAVIHHGGSGTTAAGLEAGLPAMITPFTFDQGFWGRRLADLGVGLRPIPFGKLTAARLADSMRQLTNDKDMQKRAAELGQRIQSEKGIPDTIRLLRGYLGQPLQAN